MTVSRINISPDGNAANSATMTLYARTPKAMAENRARLPEAVASHALTIADGNKLHVPIDGSFTSSYLDGMLGALGVSDAARTALRPNLSKAVIDAQIGQGLAKHAGIAEIALNAAPQTVASAAGRDASAGRV